MVHTDHKNVGFIFVISNVHSVRTRYLQVNAKKKNLMSQLLITVAVHLQLIMLIWQAWTSNSAEVSLYYVTGQQCANYSPCHTMSEYLEDQAHWIKPNTTFYFLPGSHTVKNSISVSIKQIESFSLVGFSQITSGSIPPVRIQCSGMLEFCFKNITNVYISNIVFLGCGLKYPNPLQEKSFAIKIPRVETYHLNHIVLNTGEALVFYDCHVLDSNGYGMIVVNTLGTSLSLVAKCKFHNSTNGGNALFILSNMVNGAHTLNISSCTFSNGMNTNVYLQLLIS